MAWPSYLRPSATNAPGSVSRRARSAALGLLGLAAALAVVAEHASAAPGASAAASQAACDMFNDGVESDYK